MRNHFKAAHEQLQNGLAESAINSIMMIANMQWLSQEQEEDTGSKQQWQERMQGTQLTRAALVQKHIRKCMVS